MRLYKDLDAAAPDDPQKIGSSFILGKNDAAPGIEIEFNAFSDVSEFCLIESIERRDILQEEKGLMHKGAAACPQLVRDPAACAGHGSITAARGLS